MTDSALVTRLVAEFVANRKNPAGMAALSELLDQFWAEGLECANAILRNEADADDAMQRAALKLIENIDTFKTEKGFSNWFFWTVRCQTLDLYRLRKRRYASNTSEYPLAVLCGREAPAHVHLEQEEFLAKFWAFAGTLNRKKYAVLWAVIVRGMSYSEASAALGIGRSSVQKRMESIRPGMIAAVGALPEDTSFTLDRRAAPRESDESLILVA